MQEAVSAQYWAYLALIASARSAVKGYAMAWNGCTGGSRPLCRSFLTCTWPQHGVSAACWGAPCHVVELSPRPDTSQMLCDDCTSQTGGRPSTEEHSCIRLATAVA